MHYYAQRGGPDPSRFRTKQFWGLLTGEHPRKRHTSNSFFFVCIRTARRSAEVTLSWLTQVNSDVFCGYSDRVIRLYSVCLATVTGLSDWIVYLYVTLKKSTQKSKTNYDLYTNSVVYAVVPAIFFPIFSRRTQMRLTNGRILMSLMIPIVLGEYLP